MKFSVDDIQIFIRTHNRAHFLKEALLSILNQTAKINKITILDNESTDNTEQVVKEFSNNGVKYVKTYGFLGNFYKAQEIANKEYVMLFHDDDILHPKYIETAVKLLNKHNNVSLITTKCPDFENKIPNFSKIISNKYHLFKTSKDFAYYIYFIEHIAYAPAIYRTKYFINVPLEYDKYSKANDWPFMVKIANYGNSVLLDDANIYYRRKHGGQDFLAHTHIPSLEQIANWDRCFYDAMQIHNKFSIKYLMFKIRCQHFMEVKYNFFLPEQYKQNFTLEKLWKVSNKLNPYKLPVSCPHILFKFCLKFKFFGWDK